MGFEADDRAVSGVIGAVLLFGFLVLLLSIYQLQFVPAQNEKVEFEHSLTVQNDMLELRNAILAADSTGETTFATIKLGTLYPNRILTINPPPASGSLQTEEPKTIRVVDSGGDEITGICPTGGPIQTRTLRYSPGYHEYQNAPTIVYENSVLYLDFGDRTVLLTDEQLIQRDAVNINNLNTTFGEGGVRSITVEPVPGNVRSTEVENATITYPTGLSEQTWEQLLAEDINASQVSVTDGNLSITTSGNVEVDCSPVGLNQAPPGGTRAGTAIDINPAGPNDVELREIARPNQDTVTAAFNNTGVRDAYVIRARMAFYSNPTDTGGDLGPINMSASNGTTVLSMEILGPTRPLNPRLHLPGNNTETTVTFENTGGEKFSQDDFFVVQFTFSNGREGTYFIDVPA